MATPSLTWRQPHRPTPSRSRLTFALTVADTSRHRFPSRENPRRQDSWSPCLPEPAPIAPRATSVLDMCRTRYPEAEGSGQKGLDMVAVIHAVEQRPAALTIETA